jgi:hypothetical protein
MTLKSVEARGRDLDLKYFRDVDGREVDFVVTERSKAILLVGCKWTDADVGKGLRYLKRRFPAAEAVPIAATGTKDYETDTGIRVRPAVGFLRSLV